jgi:hypothetical protein
MNNLALTYASLGRFQESLDLEEGVLQLRQRVLPENHPSICRFYSRFRVVFMFDFIVECS